jgi:amino acid adenylation domain-containing protein
MMSSLHRLLEHAARQHADRIAIEDPERETKITYGELDALSAELRDALVRSGVQRGDRVGVYARKSIPTVAAIFGILKAGAAYVPIDSGSPVARCAYILEDCSVRAVVTARDLEAGLREAFEGQTLRPLEALAGVEAELALIGGPQEDADPPPSSSGELSYILYTSGSTGQPKGVMHTSGSALSFVDWCSETFGPTEQDRFSSHAPFHFDLSILDLYVPLKHGATLVLIGEDLGKQPLRLAPVIAERRISVWYSTPSILRLLAEHGRMDQYDYSALRLVLFAGEVFPIKHVRALQRFWSKPRYFNLYGPTETNVCTYYELPSEIPEARTEPFPIGKACSNDRTRVVDDQERQVEPGEEGELYVSGGSVMNSYWNLPERTAKAFFRDEAGSAWYRTGDIVREDTDGDYEFIGRRDRMVKRRGYRVELGEIEAALYLHPAITEAAVIAVPDEESGVLIKAFLSWSEGERGSLIQLKKFCAEQLPLYMVPDSFSFQRSLPKTPTDKMDYQKLKEID